MRSLLKKDPVLCISALAAALSMLWTPPSAAYLDYLDLRVLALLFSLMVVVSGLREAGLFDRAVFRLLSLARNTRTLALVLVGACFFSSMLVTNDVALLTFVPLSILILDRAGQGSLRIPVIALQTVGANLGSILTPMGNPQNLYLYSLSGMSTGEFLRITGPVTALALVLLAAAILFLIRPAPVPPPSAPPEERGAGKWLALFGLCLLTVLRILPWGVTLAAVTAATFFWNRHLLRRADYGLLLTFVFFFVFVGNLKQVPAVSALLSRLIAGRELTVGILLSQVISNVPAAMLLSGFTADYVPLLLGVNLGGLGTLIASMASLISYKLYAAADHARPLAYLGWFTVLNGVLLAALWAAAAFIPGMTS